MPNSEGGCDAQLSWCSRCSGRRPRPASWSSTPSNIVGGLAISRDITERKQTERALARSARKYRDLAEQASHVVSRSDVEGVYTYVSPASARVYGRSPDGMLAAALQLELIEHPALLEGRPVTARASIGVAELDAELDVDGVLRCADRSMCAVKRSRS